MTTRTDAELVAAATSGDVDAFAILSRRYRDAYTRFAVRMVGNRDEAEDVLQSAFIRAFRALRVKPSPQGAFVSLPGGVAELVERLVAALAPETLLRSSRAFPRTRGRCHRSPPMTSCCACRNEAPQSRSPP